MLKIINLSTPRHSSLILETDGKRSALSSSNRSTNLGRPGKCVGPGRFAGLKAMHADNRRVKG
ncbi:MAG: hypothetical protein CVU61_08055 [Deltaproteobacteria bacterium HGW-Deltaproteobacteria-19]|nr:MAG: hypothetical protein CVU61_08055 [Deltaproteobacteria bacterium HGW-Deltaproteobacteria-19]